MALNTSLTLLRKSLNSGYPRLGCRFLRSGRRGPVTTHAESVIPDGDEEQHDRYGLNRLEDSLSELNSIDPEDHRDEIAQMRKQERQFIKRKILDRKYNQAPKEENLLTWAAKEQIRHLHALDQGDWTVDKLADSFPVSRDVVIKVLKSRLKLRTDEEIQKHDKRVYRRWLELRSGLDKEGVPINPTLTRLIEGHKMPLMIHADGVKGLPSPVQPQLPSSRNSSRGEPERVGQFQAIIRSYKYKQQDSTISGASQTNAPDKAKLLSHISMLECTNSVAADVKSKSVATVKSKPSSPESESSCVQPIPNSSAVVEKQDIDVVEGRDVARTPSRREKRRLSKNTGEKVQVTASNIDVLQMFQTEKVARGASGQSPGGIKEGKPHRPKVQGRRE